MIDEERHHELCLGGCRETYSFASLSSGVRLRFRLSSLGIDVSHPVVDMLFHDAYYNTSRAVAFCNSVLASDLLNHPNRSELMSDGMKTPPT